MAAAQPPSLRHRTPLEYERAVRLELDCHREHIFKGASPILDGTHKNSACELKLCDVVVGDDDRPLRIAVYVGDNDAQWLAEVFEAAPTPSSSRSRVYLCKLHLVARPAPCQLIARRNLNSSLTCLSEMDVMTIRQNLDRPFGHTHDDPLVVL